MGIRPTALLLAALPILGSAPPSAAAESLAAQVNLAIEKGVAWIRKWQKEDGDFDTHYTKDYPDGVTALALYTLLRSGVPAEDPIVRKALEALRYRKLTHTYSAGLRVLALDALNDPGLDDTIRSVAKWLEDEVNERDRVWDSSPKNNQTDLSNTQFAVLGLWAAERHGFKAKDATWSNLLLVMPSYQTVEGGFFYSQNREAKVATGGVTVAGILALEIAMARVDPHRTENGPLLKRAKECLARAWEYMDRRFTPSTNFEGAYAFRHDWFYYYLWGVERVAAVANREKIGGRDWYTEGARVLVEAQRGEGDWGNLHDSCFALLFLRRATFTLTGGEGPKAEGEGVGARPAEPQTRPGPTIPFVRRWLLLGPLPNPRDTLLEESPFKESEARPRAETPAAGRKWTPYRSPCDWVDLKEAVGATEESVTWAFTWLHVAEDQDAVLWVGHDDAFRVLLDGQLLAYSHFHEAAAPDGVGLRVRLTKGIHRVLVAIEERWGGTGLCLRMCRPDGTALSGVVPSLSDLRPETEETAQAQPGLFDLKDLLRLLPTETALSQGFEDSKSLVAVSVGVTDFGGHWPRWLDGPRKPRERGPAGEFQGAIGVHPDGGGKVPARLLRKVRLPAGHTAMRVRVTGESGESGGEADTVVRLGVFWGEMAWLREDVVGGVAKEGKDRWQVLEAGTDPWAGREVLLVVEVAYGGRTIAREEAWIDEFSVVHR